MNQQKTLSAIPHINGLPLFGNLLDVRNDRLGLLLRISQECGAIGTFSLGLRKAVLINSSELVNEVLVERAASFEKPDFERIFLKPAFGNGLILSENTLNKRHRKFISPAFHKRHLSTYASVITSYTERIQFQWTEREPIDLVHEMARLMLWINSKLLFGVDLLDESSELGLALTIGQHHANAKFSALVPIPYSWPTPGNVRFRKAMTCLNATISCMIKERKHAREDQGDLLSMLLEARDEEDGSLLEDADVEIGLELLEPNGA